MDRCRAAGRGQIIQSSSAVQGQPLLGAAEPSGGLIQREVKAGVGSPGPKWEVGPKVGGTLCPALPGRCRPPGGQDSGGGGRLLPRVTFTPTCHQGPPSPCPSGTWELGAPEVQSCESLTEAPGRLGRSPKVPADSMEPGHAHKATVSTPQSRGQGWPPAPQTGEGQVQMQAGTVSASSAPPTGRPPMRSDQCGLGALSTTPSTALPDPRPWLSPHRGQSPHPEMHRPASGARHASCITPAQAPIYVHTPTHITRTHTPTRV